jgi:hypothetical protein
MSFNPYRHAAIKIRALLQTEAKMSPEERQMNQWTLLIKFADTQMVIGKGDVNTMFLILGATGKRRVCYPDSLLEKLTALGDQRYWRYELETPGSQPENFWSLAALERTTVPVRGSRVYGIRSSRDLVYRSQKGLDGYEWRK